MKERSRVELFERIRRDARDEGLSIRTLAVRHHVHRRLVRQALADASPPPRRRARRAAPALGPHVATVRRWLTEDLEAPRKQRHTARRVWQRLCVEEGASVAESTVRVLVAELRRELAGGAGRVSVPQRHGPAEEALCRIPRNASYGEPGNMPSRPRPGRGLPVQAVAVS
jgi:hypothetical protein